MIYIRRICIDLTLHLQILRRIISGNFSSLLILKTLSFDRTVGCRQYRIIRIISSLTFFNLSILIIFVGCSLSIPFIARINSSLIDLKYLSNFIRSLKRCTLKMADIYIYMRHTNFDQVVQNHLKF